ncbi:MAG: acyl carrier protein [Flavobacteriales bacterium]|nr:MAG: acyl carrier protein [Flavobacteriales bacterium]
MGLDEFVGKIKEEFSEDYNVGDLDPDTHIKDMEWWSSMHMLVVIALVDAEYDVMLSPEEVREATSIKSLFEIIKTKK